MRPRRKPGSAQASWIAWTTSAFRVDTGRWWAAATRRSSSATTWRAIRASGSSAPISASQCSASGSGSRTVSPSGHAMAAPVRTSRARATRDFSVSRSPATVSGAARFPRAATARPTSRTSRSRRRSAAARDARPVRRWARRPRSRGTGSAHASGRRRRTAATDVSSRAARWSARTEPTRASVVPGPRRPGPGAASPGGRPRAARLGPIEAAEGMTVAVEHSRLTDNTTGVRAPRGRATSPPADVWCGPRKGARRRSVRTAGVPAARDCGARRRASRWSPGRRGRRPGRSHCRATCRATRRRAEVAACSPGMERGAAREPARGG